MNDANEIVAKLWNLCHIMRDDGITYHQYVTELTYLLFLKMAKETKTEADIPQSCRWDRIRRTSQKQILLFYNKTLTTLGRSRTKALRSIYAGSSTAIRQSRNLAKLVDSIDEIEWHSDQLESLGDLYEGLLERNAGEFKSGAGQYFTPRPLIDAIITCIKPEPTETVQDPACGTGGFFTCCDRAIRKRTNDLKELTLSKRKRYLRGTYVGMELVHDTHRLLLMNTMLHELNGQFHLGDTLSKDRTKLPKADVILSNPPFGTQRGGGRPTRVDLPFQTGNKQLSFLQHIYLSLKPGGRAAVVVPDNVLFEAGVGTKVRADLFDKCDVHTLLRLPKGIFYAPGVLTNVVFFNRRVGKGGKRPNTWVYDFRSNTPVFGKRTPLTAKHFQDFIKSYGVDPRGTSRRRDSGKEGRFRSYSFSYIQDRNYDLNITWLRPERYVDPDELPEPWEIAAQLEQRLKTALAEIRAVKTQLKNGGG